jgi:hypothetical protein
MAVFPGKPPGTGKLHCPRKVYHSCAVGQGPNTLTAAQTVGKGIRPNSVKARSWDRWVAVIKELELRGGKGWMGGKIAEAWGYARAQAPDLHTAGGTSWPLGRSAEVFQRSQKTLL